MSTESEPGVGPLLASVRAGCVADLRSLGADLRDAAARVVHVAEQWRDAAQLLSDPEERTLAASAVERALDRYDQLAAVLRHVEGVPESLTTSDVISRVLAVAQRRHPDLLVDALSPGDQTVGLREALALEVGLLMAVSNTARHGPPGTCTTISAEKHGGAVVVSVVERVPDPYASGVPVLSEGLGTRMARSVLAGCGGSFERVTTDLGVRVTLSIPEARAVHSVGEETCDHLEVIHACAFEVQASHGFAQPLLEARWLVPGDVSEQLLHALRGFSEVGAPAVYALRDGQALWEDVACLLAQADVRADPSPTIRTVGDVETGFAAVPPWMAIRARWRVLEGVAQATESLLALPPGERPESALVTVVSSGEPAPFLRVTTLFRRGGALDSDAGTDGRLFSFEVPVL